MKYTYLTVLLFVFSNNAFAQNKPTNGIDSDDKGVKIGDLVKMSGNWFIAYRNGIKQVQADENTSLENKEINGFVLKRSYFTLKKDLTDVFSVRYTMDLTIDKEGEDAGNVETRLKYLYLKAKPKLNSETFTSMWIEAGMVHRPWLDYEQKINTYRVQDNMFIERNKIFNSADFGITIGGTIGPKMEKEFLNEVNGAMKGKYFDYVFGLYNGGGYSGEEKNRNKVFAARLSTRPFANSIPQLQVSGYFNIGKGNSEDNPDFNQVLGFIAYTARQFTLTAQYHKGEGDFRAKYVHKDDLTNAYQNNGYSFFCEYKVKKTPLSIWGRYDKFNIEAINQETERYIGGITYRVNDMIRIVLDTEHSINDGKKEDIYELNLEISF